MTESPGSCYDEWMPKKGVGYGTPVGYKFNESCIWSERNCSAKNIYIGEVIKNYKSGCGLEHWNNWVVAVGKRKNKRYIRTGSELFK